MFSRPYPQKSQGLMNKILGALNLNDSRWGRGDEPSNGNAAEPSLENKPDADGQKPNQAPHPSKKPTPQGPPDLDELWREFNRKLNGFFSAGRNNSGGQGQPPEMKGASIGLGLIVGLVALIWLGTGFFIVQEGQQAVITQFGKYKSTVGAGFNWRLPYPIQRHELVFVTQIRSVDVGRDTVLRATGLRDSAMLTEDENIVEIKFAVQYRLSNARAYLFESKSPAEAVVQAAETAVREVVGKMKMDSALAEERDQIGPRVRALMQTILDRYKVGIEVVGINLQQGGVRPPEQVQSAFDDVLKAGQERERSKNEAQAYANDVIPRAVGAASRLKEEAEAYKARIVAQAQGDSQRFKLLLNEYQKSPQVTRDRLYIESMQQIYSNVTKVLVESKQGSNLLYLPLDKLMQTTASDQSGATTSTTNNMTPSAPSSGGSQAPSPSSSRDSGRARERDIR